jgi:hypothetical protein
VVAEEPLTKMLADAHARALFDAAKALGRAEKAADDLKAQFVDLHGFVNEQLAVNYQDHQKRIEALEAWRGAQRASWKTITGLVAAVTGGSGFVTLIFEWLKGRAHG